MCYRKLFIAFLCFLVLEPIKSHAGSDQCRPLAVDVAASSFKRDFPRCAFKTFKIEHETQDLYTGAYTYTIDFTNSNLLQDQHCPTMAEYFVHYETPPPVRDCQLAHVSLSKKEMADFSEIQSQTCYRISAENQKDKFAIESHLYPSATKLFYNSKTQRFSPTNLKDGDLFIQATFISFVPVESSFDIGVVPIIDNRIDSGSKLTLTFRNEGNHARDKLFFVDFRTVSGFETVTAHPDFSSPGTLPIVYEKCYKGICVEMGACSDLVKK